MKTPEDDDTFLARWLNNELSESEKNSFEKTEDFHILKKILDETDQLSLPDFNAQNSLEKIKEKQRSNSSAKNKSLVSKPFFRWAIAATILALISLGYYTYNVKYNFVETIVTTQTGIQEKINLIDGSSMTINSKSIVSYTNKDWINNRIINLTGEAFFEVKKGSEFKVITPQGTITVLGTSFNVKHRKSYLEVLCYTGKVMVKSNYFEKILNPGMELRLKKGRLPIVIDKVLNQKNPSWSLGITKLENVPLSEALEELTFQYELDIKPYNINDSIKFTGDFPNNDLKTAIKMVLDPFNLVYELDEETKKLIIKNE